LTSIREDIASFAIRKFSNGENDSNSPFSIGKSIEESSGILICMPEDEKEFRIARYVFKSVFAAEVSNRVTIILTENNSNSFQQETNARKIVLKKSDIGFWKIPKSKWIIDQGFSEYDLTVDLNTNFCLYSAYLCKKLGNGLLIGFSWNNSDEFYNVVLEMQGTHTNLEKVYRTIRDEYTNLIPIESIQKIKR